MLCGFEYLGKVRTLRNLIYELTSYVQEDEPISIQLSSFLSELAVVVSIAVQPERGYRRGRVLFTLFKAAFQATTKLLK